MLAEFAGTFPPRWSGHGLRKHSCTPPRKRHTHTHLRNPRCQGAFLSVSQPVVQPRAPGRSAQGAPASSSPASVSRLRLRGGRRGPPRESDGLFPVVVVEQFVLFHPPPSLPTPLVNIALTFHHLFVQRAPDTAARCPRRLPPPPRSPLPRITPRGEAAGSGLPRGPRQPCTPRFSRRSTLRGGCKPQGLDPEGPTYPLPCYHVLKLCPHALAASPSPHPSVLGTGSRCV